MYVELIYLNDMIRIKTKMFGLFLEIQMAEMPKRLYMYNALGANNTLYLLVLG